MNAPRAYPATTTVEGPAGQTGEPVGRRTSRNVDHSMTSALDAAQRAFDTLVAVPSPLALDCRGLDPGWDLPDRMVPLDELQQLLAKACWDARDAVWQRLIGWVRQGQPQWRTGAIGVGLPMLRRATSRIVATYCGDPADIDAEVLAGFLHAVHHIELGPPRLAGRLMAAAGRAGWQAHHADLREYRALSRNVESRPPSQPYGHPDLLLGRAVTRGYLSAEDAALISMTCLDGHTVTAVASRFGTTAQILRMRRSRAAHHLAAVIRAGHLTDTAAGI